MPVNPDFALSTFNGNTVGRSLMNFIMLCDVSDMRTDSKAVFLRVKISG